jgi:hypothetical protein
VCDHSTSNTTDQYSGRACGYQSCGVRGLVLLLLFLLFLLPFTMVLAMGMGVSSISIVTVSSVRIAGTIVSLRRRFAMLVVSTIT